jgi:hypothetical protein
MSESPIRVGRATDTDRYLATDQMVWFQGISAAPIDRQLTGLAEEHRFAAEIEGSDA